MCVERSMAAWFEALSRRERDDAARHARGASLLPASPLRDACADAAAVSRHGESPCLTGRGLPDWLADLICAYSSPRGPGEALSAEQCAAWGPLTLCEPLVRRAVQALDERLAADLQAEDSPPFDRGAASRLLIELLTSRLMAIVARTWALELQVARLRGELCGSTPQERFCSFAQRLARPEHALALLHEYPVLARHCVRACRQWVELTAEFLARLTADWNRLAATFGLAANDRLISVKGTAGDRHCGGRTVLELEFRSGRRLMYKPKPLAIDARFQELLDWLNRRGADPPLRPLAIVDRGEYGWAEFVEAASCDTAEQVVRFYRRQGAHLAIFYLLGATDLHYENLVASGEFPLVVDLEALFHQPLPAAGKDVASRGLSNSVVASRLLPQATFVEGIDGAVDFSGLGAQPGQPIPFACPTWEGWGTDEMRLTTTQGHVGEGRHRPQLAGQVVRLADYQGDLIAGFSATYRLLTRHRRELVGPGGLLAKMARSPVRFIARPSQTYAILLDRSIHPDSLRDALVGDRLFDRLAERAVDVACLGRLLAAERADLHEGDIPVFRTLPGSCDLWTSRGERIAGFFPRPALIQASQRAARLGRRDLARQIWLIRASFATMLAAGGPTAFNRAGAGRSRESHPARDELLAGACRIGERLLRLAWRGEDEIGWIGIFPRGRGWSLGALGLDPIEGLLPVTLFLAELGQATSRSQFARAARQAAAEILRRIERRPPGWSWRPPAAAMLLRVALLVGDEGLAHAAGKLGGGRRSEPVSLSQILAWARRVGRRRRRSAARSLGLCGGLAGQGLRQLAAAQASTAAVARSEVPTV